MYVINLYIYIFLYMHICLYVPYMHKNPQSLSHPSRPTVQAQYLPCPPPKALPSAPAQPARPGWPFDLQPAAAPASVGGCWHSRNILVI